MMWLGVWCALQLAQAEKAPSESEALFRRAREQMKAGETAQACELFEKSYKVEPALGTLLNWSVCLETLGKHAQAYVLFNEASAWAARLKDHRREQFAFQHSQTLKAKVSWLAIQAKSLVPGLRVKLRDETHIIYASPLVLPVDPGEVEVTLTAPEHHDLTQRFNIKHSGETVSWEAPSLIPREPAANATNVAAPVPAKPSNRWMSVMGLSGGLALSAAGAIGLGWSYSTYNKLQQQKLGTDTADAPTVTREEFSRLQVIYPSSWAAVGVGTVTTLVSTWFLLQRDQKATHVTVLPTSDGAWVTLQSGF